MPFMIVLAVACTVALSAQVRADPPPLSMASINDLPAAVRRSVKSAYENARAQPHDATAIGRLAMLLHALEQHRLAAEYYRIASRLDARALAWSYLEGLARSDAGDTAKALAAFRRTLTIDGEYLPARVRQAAALLAAGDVMGSRSAYEALVRSFPELALAHYGLGRVLNAVGDAEAGRRHYQNAVTLVPRFGRAHYALALAYRDEGMTSQAEFHLNAYRRFGSSAPAIPDPSLDEVRSIRGTAREWLVKGARAAGAGRNDEAIALHLEALAADPTATQAHVNLISLYGRVGRTHEAEQHYRSALRLEKHLAEAHYNYGVLQAALARDAEAAEAFRQALAADPFHPSAHKNLGALLARQKKYDEAAEHYRQAVSSNPRYDAARFSLGEVLVALGRPHEAIPQFEKLPLGDGAETPRYRHGLAVAFVAAGEIAKGIAQAELALSEAERLGRTDS